MFKKVLKSVILIGVMSLVMPCMTGCLVSGNSNTTITGKQISNSVFSQIEVGKTTKGELVALLGPASSSNINESDPTMEVLRYSYSKTKTGGSALFLIWGHSDSTTEKEETTFVFRNDVLQSYNRE